MSTEAIMSTLLGLAEGVTWANWNEVPQRFKTTSRRIKLFSDVPKDSQPWLGQAEHEEDVSQTSNLPYKRLLKAQWVVYINSTDQKATLSVDINNLVDAFYCALKPTPADRGFPKRLTLNNQVYHCYADGKVFKDPGDIDNQGMIVFPISLLVP